MQFSVIIIRDHNRLYYITTTAFLLNKFDKQMTLDLSLGAGHMIGNQ